MITILFLLFVSTECYYELQLFRQPVNNKQYKWNTQICRSDTQQPCYYKDISYSIELYYQHEIYRLSADLTTPISWLKGKRCQTTDTIPKRCKLIEQKFFNELKNSIASLQESIKAFKRYQLSKPSIPTNIIGTLQKIQGTQEKNKSLSFWTVDSNRYVSIIKILGVGFFINEEKDQISLNHTNFINASLLDSSLNNITDGAISLRFDVDSQNSFLNEIFGGIDQTQRTITIFIDKKSQLTLGQLSSKRVVGGDEGITWIQLQNKNHLIIQSIQILKPQTNRTQQPSHNNTNITAYLSLSASYISFPQFVLKSIFEYQSSILFKHKCKKTLNGFYECFHINKQFLNSELIINIQKLSLSYTIHQLIRNQKTSSVILNIRQSDSQDCIIGQPHFHKYFTIFDYKRSRIGLGQKFIIPEETVVTSVTMVRFMVFCFILCCILLCLSKPINNLMRKLKMKLTQQNIKSKQTKSSNFQFINDTESETF